MKAPSIYSKKARLFSIAAGLCAMLNFSALSTPVVLDTAINPANNHRYYLLDNSTWADATNAAVALHGNLVTINDLEENNWIWDRWGTNRSLWIGLYVPIPGGGGGGHAEDFVWVSGAPSSYRNWRPGEPNGDNYAYILAKGLDGGGQWNDVSDGTTTAGQPPLYGVVEVDFCSPHSAQATAIVINGFVVGANISDFGCGYTNAPFVLIQGGGGSGATATATINSNGYVTAINIIAAGSGYTNVPTILIASPPFVPTLGISISRVKVTQNVVLGLNYLLESSTNLIDWTATGPSFTATNETMVAEFDVDLTGRYFRIRQVP